MLGTSELIVILCVVLILFGGKKLPELAKSIGLGIREFKKACNGLDEEQEKEMKHNSTAKKMDEDAVVLEIKPERKDPNG